MYDFNSGFVVALAIISPQDLAKYIVTAFFTLINLLITYLILKKFLFKPAMKFLADRKKAVIDEIEAAKLTKAEANEKFAEASARIESSIMEATNIVSDAKIQAESQSDAIIQSARKEASDIILRTDAELERMRKAMMEEMRDEVADLSVAIASKVIRQSIDETKQKEIIDRFIGEELDGKESANGAS